MASVAKRKWKKPDGSTGEVWIVRYVAGGKHKQKTFARQKEASAFRVKIEGQQAAGALSGVVRDCTVAQAASEYAKYIDRRFDDGQIKRGSHRNLSTVIAKSILPHLGKARLADIDANMLERWFATLREADGLSSRTALDRLIYFATFWKFAKRRKMVAGENPASAALEHIGRLPKARIRTIGAADVQRLLSAASERRKWQSAHSFRVTQIVVSLAAFSGLRLGEILALRLCDVDLEQRLVHVRHTLNDWDELTTPKTRDSRRVVPIPQHVAEMIGAYIAECYTPNDRQLILRTSFGRLHPAGGPIRVSGFGVQYWQPLVKHAGLHEDGDALHFHALRHFAASWWLQNKLPITEASRLLGHANPTITLAIYSHAIMEVEERDSALDTMSSALLHGGAIAHQLRIADKNPSNQTL